MPLRRDDYDPVRAERFDEEKVLQLLRSNPGQVFSVTEIANAIEPPSTEPLASAAEGFHAEALRDIAHGMRETTFRSFLDRMVDKGKIAKSLLRKGSPNDWYYSSRP